MGVDSDLYGGTRRGHLNECLRDLEVFGVPKESILFKKKHQMSFFLRLQGLESPCKITTCNKKCSK